MAESTLGERIRGWLTYRGTGLPRARPEQKFLDLAVVLIVAATIWGHMDVSRRGRIEGDKPETHRTDFTVYVEAGAAFFDHGQGRDPYKVMNARGWTYLYPPLLGLMVAPLHVFDTITQVSVWYAVSVVLCFGCTFEARRVWRTLTRSDSENACRPFPWGWFVMASLVSVWVPGLDCMQRGQIGIALLYALLLGYRLVVTGSTAKAWFLGGFVFGWAVVLKLIPVLPVGFVVFQTWAAIGLRGWLPKARAGTRGRMGGGFCLRRAVPAMCVGWSKNLEYLAVWGEKVAFNKDPGLASHSHVDSYTNQSLTNGAHLLAATFKGPVPEASMKVHWIVVDRAIAQRRRDDWQTRQVVHVVQGIALALLLATGVKASRHGTRLGRAFTFGLACMMILLISPVAWGHYYVLALPAALFGPRWLWGRGHPRLAGALALVSALLPTIHYLVMPWVGDYGLLGLGTTAWFLTACVLYLAVSNT